ncbi:MAG: cell division protein FtsA [Bacteroidales bacterium]|jgi:cell division protein FtsA|nr:cell division protein FtsA [Bacteroidales bacterium]
MQAERYIAAADLGSSKIALSVAKIEGDDIQIIYYKETPSDGIRYSCVFNPKRAAVPLCTAIKEAEEELNIKILQVVVGLPRYHVRQEIASARMERSNPSSCITKEEVNTLKSIAIDSYPITDETKEEIYGAVAQSFSADEELVCASENDVVGTTADALEGNFKVFVGEKKPVSNIDIMLNDAQVAPACKLFLPNAVAKAVLSEAERENGVALVEIGAGVTSLTIYRGRILRHYSSIPFGGRVITTDIKYECGFNEQLAENIKLAFGACMPEKLQSLSEKVIQINDQENGSYDQLPVKYLSEIITCRAREIIEAILFQIQDSGYADKLRNGIVLTGGGANLVNFANLLKEMSGYTVRIGFPRSQAFSSVGCSGVGETSSVATIGMILEAKKDFRLNCIEEAQTEEAPQAAAGPDGPSADGGPAPTTLFDDTDIIVPKKKKNEPSKFIRWMKQQGKKVSSAAEDAFDNTVGGLFDDMK